MGLATVAVQRAELDKALVLYQKAATIEETDKTLCGIGLVHMEKGEHTEAFDYFTRALEKSSGNLVALNCMVREAYQTNQVEKFLLTKPFPCWNPLWKPVRRKKLYA